MFAGMFLSCYDVVYDRMRNYLIRLNLILHAMLGLNFAAAATAAPSVDCKRKLLDPTSLRLNSDEKGWSWTTS